MLLPKHIICKNTEHGGDMTYVDEQVNTHSEYSMTFLQNSIHCAHLPQMFGQSYKCRVLSSTHMVTMYQEIIQNHTKYQ